MTSLIENFFASIFGNNVVLATILIAIIPVIELKGAIPFSMSTQIWGINALSSWGAFGCGLLGSSLIVPVLALVYIPLIRWLKTTKLFKRIGEKLENRVNSKKEKIENDTKNEKSSKKTFWIKIISVFTFVAIPLPFTGVWTGTCLAVALGLNYWISCGTVIIGNVVAGLIITLISHFFGDATLIFFYIFIGIILAGIIFFIIKSIVNKKKHKTIERE